ncbi:hypothetical protein QCA50_014197 [Cerrena zonata]|uniref:protein-tyrosine-phosphatase n=1 Tax=Cerrena zonata TaxID=2478898 RepID=A0AAW0FP61_9APHY
MVKRGKSNTSSEQSTVSLVIPSLYLGPCSAALSQSFLTTNSITHILSIGSSPANKVDGITYLRLSLSDSPSSSISKVSDAACTFIETALKSRNGTGKVFIHCSAGISRSPTIVAAYLMKCHNLSLKAALRQILKVRSQVSPNSGFLSQLKELDLELFGSISLDIDTLPRTEKERLALFEDAG